MKRSQLPVDTLLYLKVPAIFSNLSSTAPMSWESQGSEPWCIVFMTWWKMLLRIKMIGSDVGTGSDRRSRLDSVALRNS